MRDHWLDRRAAAARSILCPAQDPLAAAAEIRRAAEDRASSTCCSPGGSERPYGEPRYLPIFEAAAECGLPVTIHSGGEGMGLSAPPGGAGLPTFYIEWHTLGSACSDHGPPRLADLPRHLRPPPHAQGLLIEGGIAWLPGILWRLDTNWRGLRSEIPWVDRKPSEIVREHVRFSTQPLEHTDGHDALLFEMLEAAGAPDILVFASDYPHWDFDDPTTCCAGCRPGATPSCTTTRRPSTASASRCPHSRRDRDRRRPRVQRCGRWRHLAQRTGRASSGAAWRSSRSRWASSSSR